MTIAIIKIYSALYKKTGMERLGIVENIVMNIHKSKHVYISNIWYCVLFAVNRTVLNGGEHREMGGFPICIIAYDSHLLTLYFRDFMSKI